MPTEKTDKARFSRLFPTSGQETELVAALSTPEPARGDVDDDDNDDR